MSRKVLHMEIDRMNVLIDDQQEQQQMRVPTLPQTSGRRSHGAKYKKRAPDYALRLRFGRESAVSAAETEHMREPPKVMTGAA